MRVYLALLFFVYLVCFKRRLVIVLQIAACLKSCSTLVSKGAISALRCWDRMFGTPAVLCCAVLVPDSGFQLTRTSSTYSSS